jgi:hypothetical protein
MMLVSFMRTYYRIIAPVLGTTLGSIAIFAILNNSSPSSLGPTGVAGFFLLGYLVLTCFIVCFQVAIGYVLNRHHSLMTLFFRSFALALPAIMLLALNTIRSVTPLDALLATVFGLVLLFYLNHR